MKTSEQVNEIAAALSKFQGAITQPPKNRTVEVVHKSGGKHSFQYAELAVILEHVKKPLAENGLSWTSMVGRAEDGVSLYSRLLHSSGQWFETEYPLPNVSDPKVFGGEITYGRRYSFTMLTGTSSDDDADNDPGTKNPLKPSGAKSPVAPKKPEPKPKGQVGLAERDHVVQLAKGRGWDNAHVAEFILRKWGKAKITDLTKPEYQELTGVIASSDYLLALKYAGLDTFGDQP